MNFFRFFGIISFFIVLISLENVEWYAYFLLVLGLCQGLLIGWNHSDVRHTKSKKKE